MTAKLLPGSLKGLALGGGPKSELGAALFSCRPAFIGVGGFSAVINLLMLTGSLYMLQVYDRVLASRSVSTLTPRVAAAAPMRSRWGATSSELSSWSGPAMRGA